MKNGPLSEPAERYLTTVADQLSRQSPEETASRVVRVAYAHEEWRRHACLNLLASENLISLGARRLLDTDLATRVAEGWPGAREFPPDPINEFSDELEAMVILLVQRLFGCRFVDCRPPSSSIANLASIAALTEPGDTILVQSGRGGGGNRGYQAGALPGLRGLRALEMAPAPDFGINVEQVTQLARENRARLLVIGGSKVLFPYPISQLREVVDDLGASLLFDAAHVSLLIACGLFQRPLAEGAHVMTTGTHKILGGPVGGLVLTDLPDVAARVSEMLHPGLVQTRDQNKLAAAAFAMSELIAFGKRYAVQSIANARALAAALEQEGFEVLAREKGYTATHQLFIDWRKPSAEAAQRLVERSILVNATVLPGFGPPDPPTGIRLSVQELTRRGMTESQMASVATLMRRSAIDREPCQTVAADVADLMASFNEPKYCFSEEVFKLAQDPRPGRPARTT
jgi:glycine hydroxymethyltransferase